MMSKYLSAYFDEPKSEAQRKFVGGKLRISASEENVDKICDQIRALAAMYRHVGEKYVRIDIMRNEDAAAQNKPEFSLMRSDWSQDGLLKAKISEYEQGQKGPSVDISAPSSPPSKPKPAPSELDDEDGIPF